MVTVRHQKATIDRAVQAFPAQGIIVQAVLVHRTAVPALHRGVPVHRSAVQDLRQGVLEHRSKIQVLHHVVLQAVGDVAGVDDRKTCVYMSLTR